MTKWIIFAGLVLLISLAVLSLYFWNSDKDKQKLSSQIEQVTPIPSPKVEYQYSAWAPNWASNEEVTVSLFNSQKKLTTLLPSWYLLNSSGKLIKQEPVYKAHVLTQTSEYKINLLPTIENQFNPKGVSKLVSSKILQQDLSEELIKIAKENNYIGYDLDWEQIDPEDKDKFSIFVAYLKNELHEDNLLLSVTVHAQTGTSDDWDQSLGHDYQALGKEADFIRIMAYDFHHPKSSPGPITPPDKLREVLTYVQKNIPAEKIILGLPTYGYDWSGKKSAAGLQYNQVLQKIVASKGSFKKDDQNMALHGEYILKEATHELWFEDASTIKLKQDIASNEFGINNFCFWHLGSEDEKIWSETN